MEVIKTLFGCDFYLAPLESFSCLSRETVHVYDIYKGTNQELLRRIRILKFLNYTDFIIHTNNFENIQGWAYELHLLYDGPYAMNFNNKKNLIN